MQKRNSCKDFKPNFTNEKGKGKEQFYLLSG